jgi:hypothetical protein
MKKRSKLPPIGTLAKVMTRYLWRPWAGRISLDLYNETWYDEDESPVRLCTVIGRSPRRASFIALKLLMECGEVWWAYSTVVGVVEDSER